MNDIKSLEDLYLDALSEESESIKLEDLDLDALSEEGVSIKEEDVHILEEKVRDIEGKLSLLEERLGNLGNNELKSCIKHLRDSIHNFFEKLNKLGSYDEYHEKKYISIKHGIIKDCEKCTMGEKEFCESSSANIKRAESTLRRKIDSGMPIFLAEISRETLLQIKETLEEHKKWVKKNEIYINRIRESLYMLLGLKGTNEENNKVFKDYEKFVKKYEYEFGQLKRRVQKILSLRIEVEKMIEKESSKQDINEVESEYKSKAKVASDSVVRVEKSMPEELKDLFDELGKNNVNSSRLRTLLWKRYDEDRIIPSRFLDDWIKSYKLTIESKKLKGILSKVFTIEEEKKEGEKIKLDGEIVTQEVVNRRESDGVIDVENGYLLEKLQSIYKKLKNKEVEAEEFYRCFFDILRECLSLKIEDEGTLIKQFKSFEKHNYFHMDILRVGENIIRKILKPVIIRKNATCSKTGKAIKFPTGPHSKVRIIITDDDRVVGLYSREDYRRYFGWSRTQ